MQLAVTEPTYPEPAVMQFIPMIAIPDAALAVCFFRNEVMECERFLPVTQLAALRYRWLHRLSPAMGRKIQTAGDAGRGLDPDKRFFDTLPATLPVADRPAGRPCIGTYGNVIYAP
jgi:hypothetical protein